VEEIRINVLVPKDLHRRAKVAAALNDTTISAIVRQLLEEYIEDTEDSRLLNESEARVAAGRQRTHSAQEVRTELDALPDRHNAPRI
jgi:predicted DNA-binding protein